MQIAAGTHTIRHAYAYEHHIYAKYIAGVGSEATVADVGELGLEPLDAAADGGLEPALRGEHVVRRHTPPPLRLRVFAGARPVEAVRLAGALAADVLVVVPAAAAVVGRRVLMRHRSALLHRNSEPPPATAMPLPIFLFLELLVWTVESERVVREVG
uniref:Uncharacterized protein n=1 Tax=Arundo donax TaxID=35708 RepID=A0A0A9BE05_ARUDO